jgi:hypothetical protein
MEDTLCCPICNKKLRNIRLVDHHMPTLGKTSNFVQRTCMLGQNHGLHFFVDEVTGKVDLLKVSLTHQYNRFVEINYILNKIRISCLKDGQPNYIEIAKILEPDFPDLTKLKERVGIYLVFS